MRSSDFMADEISTKKPHCLFSQSLVLLIFLLALASSCQGLLQADSSSAAVKQNVTRVSAVFAFGDSTLDSGNNNYLVTPYKSDFLPYGKDFFGHKPTGRFTNGRLLTDFAASYVGLKEEVPAYLDPSLSLDDLITGVCFASAGSGFDPLTAEINQVIPMGEQIDYFRDYLSRIELQVGPDRMDKIMNNAVFIISAGTNDFAANYIPLPIRKKMFSIADYQNFVLQNLQEFLQGIHKLGARKMAVVGLPPVGCLPVIITLFGFGDRKCIEAFNSMSIIYNNKLKDILRKASTVLQGAQLIYVDVFTPLYDFILSPNKYGFEETMVGCCGTGMVEAGLACNANSLVCIDASKYVFWDSIHPTEKTYLTLFNYFKPLIDNFLESSN
ncbi:GDSL esterase/lipase At5g45960-like isoform X2 [Dioscorea cayenensis subsp. rotundata]|nr:GDSL esterase/lipase At5g45960-like isoform X2 [Dioscorea cayenensis subsp. rotundata]